MVNGGLHLNTKKKSKWFFSMLSVVLLLVVLTACSSKEDTATEDTKDVKKETVNYADQVKENPVVTITLENDKKIVVELDPKVAPNTVANFVSLVQDGFYDGLIFHRVIPDFMIQGGDASINGIGGPNNSIKGEFSSNGFENNLLHERGVISMARTQDVDSAASQFFIMVADTPSLDGEYASFGKVIEGMDAVDEIVSVDTNPADKPVKDQIMKKVEVDTKGFEYPKPTVIEK